MLKFSNANAKIEALKNDAELAEFLTDKRKVYSLDLLSGYSCPFAEACLSKAVVQPNGKRKIRDGHTIHNSVASQLLRKYSIPTYTTYANTILIRCVNYQPAIWLTLSIVRYLKMPVLFASTLRAISLILTICEHGIL